MNYQQKLKSAERSLRRRTSDRKQTNNDLTSIQKQHDDEVLQLKLEKMEETRKVEE